MASFSVKATSSTECEFAISGFSSGDKVRFYVRLEPAPSDGSAVVNTTVTYSGTTTYKFSGLAANTEYAANVGTVSDSGSTTWIGAQYFTTPKQRPNNWSWTSTVASGASISITATEWNNFCSRINEFREYKGLIDYSFTTVYSGDSMKAIIINQARSAISSMNGSVPNVVSAGDTITASFFNGLKNALNAIT